MGVYNRGQVLITDPDAPTQEYDTFMCCHCNAIITVERSGSVNLWSPPDEIALIGHSTQQEFNATRAKRRRGFCFRCMGPTCWRGECKTKCIPFEARLEAQEGTRRFWREYELRA